MEETYAVVTEEVLDVTATNISGKLSNVDSSRHVASCLLRRGDELDDGRKDGCVEARKRKMDCANVSTLCCEKIEVQLNQSVRTAQIAK